MVVVKKAGILAFDIESLPNYKATNALTEYLNDHSTGFLAEENPISFEGDMHGRAFVKFRLIAIVDGDEFMTKLAEAMK